MVLCFTPFFSPPLALLSGIALSQTLGHPFPFINRRAIPLLLQLSIVGLGFGINLYEAAKVGKEGFWLTVITIVVTLGVGWLAGKWLKLNKNISLLISVGTAICGGSAIAAISPIVDAKEEEMTMALGTVFVLNAIALIIFPVFGHALDLSQAQFGVWSAIAIHDTSSVVGAAATYGHEALQIATTVKLGRALWIVPLSLLVAIFLKKDKRVRFPYFILLFVVAMAMNTFLSQVHTLGTWIVPLSKKGMTLTLFLIGTGLSFSSIKKVGTKPLLLGIGLWLLIAMLSLALIVNTSL